MEPMTTSMYKIESAIDRIGDVCPNSPDRKIVFQEIRFILGELPEIVDDAIARHNEESGAAAESQREVGAASPAPPAMMTIPASKISSALGRMLAIVQGTKVQDAIQAEILTIMHELTQPLDKPHQ